MSEPASTNQTPADAVRGSWVESAPRAWQPYLRLSRYDRPIGFWLLALPCLAGLTLARNAGGLQAVDAWYALLFAIGSLAMRGAGCTYNDILDRDIDAKVERTALRPLPAGTIRLSQAWAWLLAQCVVGLLVLVFLPNFARLVALASIPLVALYPLMKRITWWPQVWLGLTLNWGTLVAAAAVRGTLTLSDGLLLAALALWTVGYDTIYAAQDREDDALVGVKSSARRLGKNVKGGVWVFYVLSIATLATAAWLEDSWALAGMAAPFAVHLLWQALRFTPSSNSLSLKLFRSNRDAALLLVIGFGAAASLAI